MKTQLTDRELRRIQLHRDQRRSQIGRAAVVGVLAGVAAVAFQISVAAAERTAVWVSLHLPVGLVVLLAAVVGSLAAWVTGRFAPEAGGSGIPHIKAVLIHLRTLRPIKVISVKLAGGLLALAAGMSLGREGPTVQIGAAVGRLVGDVLKVPKRSYNALVAAGAGAGLAAAFNAPLAGFLFVMEELKREMSPITYGTALIASVCSVAITRYLLGQQASFHIPSAQAPPLSALGPIALFGVVAGLVGIAFNRALLGCLALRTHFKVSPWSAGLVVGAISGLVLVYFPFVSGGGHEITAELLLGHVTSTNLFWLCLAVCGGKLAFTALSYGTGVPGGIFAPILVMGAFLGYGFGLAAHDMAPGISFGAAGFATIGMAAVLSSSVRAPLTGVVLIVEMTAEYQLLYALLVGAFVSYATAELLDDTPIYEALLERDLHRTGQIVSDDAEPQIIEFLVEPDAEMDGRKIRDLAMPEGALITTITRNNRQLVPRGTSQIRSGDMVTAVVDGDNLMVSLRLHEMARAPD
ncbi:MAG TPA: H(+)/Cl(-) exchange transporter ClcA [Fimbriimonas sp.]|nr:H(+)/Cl(-) exchange transporter ClcA [Fimbriimonas sp.]